jgi:hypothetical protein
MVKPHRQTSSSTAKSRLGAALEGCSQPRLTRKTTKMPIWAITGATFLATVLVVLLLSMLFF